MNPVVIVGQGPNQASWKRALATGMRLQTLKRDPHVFAEGVCARLSCTGAVGRKLAKLAGYDVAQREELRFYASVDRLNLNARWNGKQGQGDLFDRVEAFDRVRAVLAQGRRAHVLLGVEVARAFDFKIWVPLAVNSIVADGVKTDFLLMPHPSGISRWWNVPGNEQRAAVALSVFLAGHGVTPRRSQRASSAKQPESCETNYTPYV